MDLVAVVEVAVVPMPPAPHDRAWRRHDWAAAGRRLGELDGGAVGRELRGERG